MRKYMKFIVIYGIALVLGLGMIVVGQQVKSVKDELRVVQSDIEAEREKIRVLKAEWAYLNRPENLERLAAKHLDLVAPVPAQMVSLFDLPVFDQNDDVVSDALAPAAMVVPRAKPLWMVRQPVRERLPRPELQKTRQIKNYKTTQAAVLPDNFENLIRRLDREAP